MRIFWALLVGGAVVISGCASKQPAKPKPAPAPQAPVSAKVNEPAKPAASEPAKKLIVTAEHMLVGTVALYNTAGRFVVLDFPVGAMPVLDQTMFVYRQGLKVGEIKITGPERDHNTVADLVSGEAQKGDEVRDR